MDKPITNIKLGFSCPVKWDEMEGAGGVRFCKHCNQKVYDFTDAKTREFLTIMAENGNSACGRYTGSQLTTIYPGRSNWKKWLSAAVVFLGINIWSSKVKAQDHLDADYPLTKSQAIIDTEIYMGKGILAGTVDRGNVDKEAEFPGGEKALNEFIRRRTDKTKRLKTGFVCVGFKVDAGGKLSDFYLRHGIGKENDTEALRVLKLMPKWKPAISKGKAVTTEYILPFTFEQPADSKD